MLQGKWRFSSTIIRVKLIFILIFILLPGSLFLYELFPRFTILSIPLPQSDYGESYWLFTTYSVTKISVARYFTYRKEATLIYKNLPDDDSRKIILNYFDDQLSNRGWQQSVDSSYPCHILLPESSFLPYIEDQSADGFVLYRKANYHPTYGSDEGDAICLAIWNDDPGVFEIVLLTSKPSPLTIFMDAIN